jgi:prolyl-tRNA editing enzyme YbaK/EbsC (Cys-tRNA(Pro) deacylase)
VISDEPSLANLAEVANVRSATTPSALRIQSILGRSHEVLEFEATTRTSEDAAAAIGCEVGHIAKSLIFRTATGRSVLVVASGVNRVDEAKVCALLGEKIARADADFVRKNTGFSIGGVPPVGHITSPIVLIDQDLARFPAVWAAAGTPNAVFQIAPADLVRLTGGQIADVARR